jgi:hypothetical protein
MIVATSALPWNVLGVTGLSIFRQGNVVNVSAQAGLIGYPEFSQAFVTVLRQTDTGPSQDPSKTGGVLRGIDINSEAAKQFGYISCSEFAVTTNAVWGILLNFGLASTITPLNTTW